MSETRLVEATELMRDFAVRTGIGSERPQRRYLWTDAFAVCNLLGLAGATGDDSHRLLALKLVERVHHTLGRHREDDPRTGWISGLGEAQGRLHPTRGGLRIGKELPERSALEPYDERLEWDRDGQYFHYLTKWMHALDQVSRATDAPRFNTWARELAATAHRAFTHTPGRGGQPRMYWKMSIDLSRPLVTSMGQHDAVDGQVTLMQLRATAANLEQPVTGPHLEEATRHFAAMAAATDLASADPLGIGGLLVDAYRLHQLARQGGPGDEDLLERLLAAALRGLRTYLAGGDLEAPAMYRLAFRELGLAIGMQAVERMWKTSATRAEQPGRGRHVQLEGLMRYVQLGEEIQAFWRQPASREAATWRDHRDINEVMLATSLAPDGFLDLASFR